VDQDAVDLALLAFRAAIGAVMFAHGWNHLFRGGKVQGTAGWFESLGMRPGVLHASSPPACRWCSACSPRSAAPPSWAP
jgi:uncharacterized membrane protein YphA (DoxX/SURF4 family)